MRGSHVVQRSSTRATTRIANLAAAGVAVGGLPPPRGVRLPMRGCTPPCRGGGAQCHKTTLTRRQVPAPNVRAQVGNKRWSGAARKIEDARLAQVRCYARVCLDGPRDHIHRFSGSGRSRQDEVEVIQEGHTRFALMQLGVGPPQRFMLAKCEQCRGQGVPLFASFSLTNAVTVALRIPPIIFGNLTIEHANKRHKCRGDFLQFAQESCPRNAVIRAAAVKRHDGRGRVAIERSPKAGSQRVHAGSCAQCVLVRPCRPSSNSGVRNQSVRETRRLNASPVAMPRTPPPGFRRAVICRDACQGDACSNFARHVRLGQDPEGFSVVQEEFVMLRPGA